MIPQFLLSLMVAFADSPQGASSLKQGLSPMIPMAVIFGILYLLVLRPQQKKQKDQQQFISSLKRGDLVVTNSGIIGSIKNLTERFVYLEIDDGVTLKMLRNQILESANALREDAKPAKA